MSEISETVQRLPYWNDLSEEEKADVTKNSAVRAFGAGEILYGGTGRCLGMIHLLKGRVRVYILSEDGREITLFRIGPGENCVISASCVISQLKFDTIMEVEDPASLLIVNAGTFQSLADKNLHVKCFLYQLATERFSQVMWVMQEVLFLRFDQRLAGFMISEYERTGSREIKMTQEEIAKQVNSAREVVARMLSQFSSDRFVELHRGKVILRDIDGLKRQARKKEYAGGR